MISSSTEQNGVVDNILRPRPIKPENPMVLRAQSEERGLKPNHAVESIPSGISRWALNSTL